MPPQQMEVQNVYSIILDNRVFLFHNDQFTEITHMAEYVLGHTYKYYILLYTGDDFVLPFGSILTVSVGGV